MSEELNITIQPDWQEMERINAQAMEFLDCQSLPADTVFACTMVICELMENSIKYGSDKEVVSVSVSLVNGSIVIKVTNKVGDNAQIYLRELERTLQRIKGVQDPYEAYLERIREISREPLSAAKSCLGLARIVYEGGADLDFIMDDDDTLNVSAIARLQ